MAKTPFDSDVVRSLAALLEETHLSEIEYETQGTRIRVVRQLTITAASPPAAATPPAAVTAATVSDPAHHPGAVTSPMVGVAYLSQEPGAARFVTVGDNVAEGQTLLLIEAMKTYNPIRAGRAGRLVALLVDDGQPVEYGEPLAIIE